MNSIKQLILVVTPTIVACLLINGCATAKQGTLTTEQLAHLKKTKTVLIVVEGVDGKRKEFFANPFKEQLNINRVTPVSNNEKGVRESEYDAVISLKCYYFDYGRFDLNRLGDLRVGFGPKSAIGVGKRIGCRLEITHKGLGKIFEGQVQGTTKQQVHLNASEFEKATSAPDAFTAYLERDAQQKFDEELKRSQGWLYVLNMRPENY